MVAKHHFQLKSELSGVCQGLDFDQWPRFPRVMLETDGRYFPYGLWRRPACGLKPVHALAVCCVYMSRS